MSTSFSSIVTLNLFQGLEPQARHMLPEMLKQVQHDEIYWEADNA